MIIWCKACRRTSFASKVRDPDPTRQGEWCNQASCCGTLYPGMPPALASQRRKNRQARERMRQAELLGQLRLFTEEGTPNE